MGIDTITRAETSMAKAAQIKALVVSHGEGDEARFYSVVMQVAAHAARSGQTTFAQELRDLVDEAKQRGPRARLRNFDLAPTRRILLVGPPGTGKTMTASALAGEPNLTIFTIQLDGLITRYLGETAAKLRLIFDTIQSTRGVYLFDEFEAIGRDRAAHNEVGEIRRVLSSFLQFLEQDPTDSIIVCATNNPSLLDRALFRRFDIVLRYGLPDPTHAIAMMQARFTLLDTTAITWESFREAVTGLSYGDLVLACDKARKVAILSKAEAIDPQVLMAALDDRRNAYLGMDTE
ncbi:MAG: ATP-binding protein [Thermomicrobiales bacterium]